MDDLSGNLNADKLLNSSCARGSRKNSDSSKQVNRARGIFVDSDNQPNTIATHSNSKGVEKTSGNNSKHHKRSNRCKRKFRGHIKKSSHSSSSRIGKIGCTNSSQQPKPKQSNSNPNGTDSVKLQYNGLQYQKKLEFRRGKGIISEFCLLESFDTECDGYEFDCITLSNNKEIIAVGGKLITCILKINRQTGKLAFHNKFHGSKRYGAVDIAWNGLDNNRFATTFF